MELLRLLIEESFYQVGLEEEADAAAELFLAKTQQLMQLMNTILDSVPSGVCTGAQFVVEFPELVQDIQEQIEVLVDLSGLVGVCRIFAENKVPGLNWPSREVVVNLYAEDGLTPFATFTGRGGEKYYGVSGVSGSDFPLVGKYWTALQKASLGGQLLEGGFAHQRHFTLVFVREDLVDTAGNCAGLENRNDRLGLWVEPGPGELLSPMVLRTQAIDPSLGDCDIVVMGEHELFTNWHRFGGSVFRSASRRHDDRTFVVPLKYRITKTTAETAFVEDLTLNYVGWIDVRSTYNVYTVGNIMNCIRASHSSWATDLPLWNDR